jgi:hypothetical protein
MPLFRDGLFMRVSIAQKPPAFSSVVIISAAFVKVASIGTPINENGSFTRKAVTHFLRVRGGFSCAVVIGFALSIGVRSRHAKQPARFAYPSKSLKSHASAGRYRK